MEIRKLTKEELELLKEFENKSYIHSDKTKKLIQLYNDVYSVKLTCYTCSSVVNQCLVKLNDLKPIKRGRKKNEK